MANTLAEAYDDTLDHYLTIGAPFYGEIAAYRHILEHWEKVITKLRTFVPECKKKIKNNQEAKVLSSELRNRAEMYAKKVEESRDNYVKLVYMPS